MKKVGSKFCLLLWNSANQFSNILQRPYLQRPWECIQEAACDPKSCSVSRLYYSMNTGKKSTNSRETTTEAPNSRDKKLRQIFWCGFRSNIISSKKQAETLYLFCSLKRQPISLETVFACTESTDLILEVSITNIHLLPHSNQFRL